MRLAGVLLTGGRMVWVEVPDVEVHPLDDVTVFVDGEEFSGSVIVAPESLLRPVEASGRIVRVSPRTTEEDDCCDLPGADMPPLGSRMDGGVVVSVDAVNRTATIEMPDGTRTASTISS